MCLQPKDASSRASIDPSLAPPSSFVSTAMDFAMVPSTKRNYELIANFAAKGP